jgi:hypothetical protein
LYVAPSFWKQSTHGIEVGNHDYSSITSHKSTGGIGEPTTEVASAEEVSFEEDEELDIVPLYKQVLRKVR